MLLQRRIIKNESRQPWVVFFAAVSLVTIALTTIFCEYHVIGMTTSKLFGTNKTTNEMAFLPMTNTSSSHNKDSNDPINKSLFATISSKEYWRLWFTDNMTVTDPTISGFLCLVQGFWGDNSNRILQLSNLIEMKRRMGYRKVALTKQWTGWYLEWFEPLDDEIELNVNFGGHRRMCNTSMKAEAALSLRNKRLGNPIVPFMIPKLSIRQEAQRAVDELKRELGTLRFVSVHRRNMDREDCHEIAADEDTVFYCLGDNVSMTVEERAHYCAVTYTDTLQLAAAASEAGDSKPHGGAPFVLFTDGRSPEYDKTFPIIDNHSFPVQMWMMVLSDFHYGNPLSSVDYVVSHWRRGKNIHPHECYKAYSSIMK